MQHKSLPKWPTWIIALIGIGLTVAIVIWLGATYDSRGEPLFDAAVSRVVVALIGGLFTLGAIFLQRSVGQIRHEVRPNSGTTMKDGISRIDSAIEKIEKDISGLRRDIGRQAVSDQQNQEEALQLRKDLSYHMEQEYFRYRELFKMIEKKM